MMINFQRTNFIEKEAKDKYSMFVQREFEYSRIVNSGI